jgi:hypothetical protein
MQCSRHPRLVPALREVSVVTGGKAFAGGVLLSLLEEDQWMIRGFAEDHPLGLTITDWLMGDALAPPDPAPRYQPRLLIECLLYGWPAQPPAQGPLLARHLAEAVWQWAQHHQSLCALRILQATRTLIVGLTDARTVMSLLQSRSGAPR